MIQADVRGDGVVAMVTNDVVQAPKQLLEVYTYRPFLEKRNEQRKSVLCVAPVFLTHRERLAVHDSGLGAR